MLTPKGVTPVGQEPRKGRYTGCVRAPELSKSFVKREDDKRKGRRIMGGKSGPRRV